MNKDVDDVKPAQQKASMDELVKIFQNVQVDELRSQALLDLLKYRETFPDFACYIWYSFGTMSAIISEIVSIYPALANNNVSSIQSHQICGCLTLMQCVASHPQTKHHFFSAQLPLYLYPFLSVPASNSTAIEFLRLTAIGVLGAMVKGEDKDVLQYLLRNDILPLCLRIIETCSELPRNVSTFIIHKILSYEEGLNNLCSTPEKFFAITTVLKKILENEKQDISPRLFKHILRCYYKLGQHPSARQSLKVVLPQCLLTCLNTGFYDNLMQQDQLIYSLIQKILDLTFEND